MSKSADRKIIALFVAFGVTACGVVLSEGVEWPPHRLEARQNFHEHRESFARLAAKLRGSKLYSVRRAFDDQVFAQASENERSLGREVDDPEWLELLNQTGLTNIRHTDGAVALEFGGMPFKAFENRWGVAEYVQHQSMLRKHQDCLPGHAEIMCGMCVDALTDDWFLLYTWAPRTLLPDQHDAMLNGNLSKDEYHKENDVLTRQCWIEGLTKIGYDAEKVMTNKTEGP